jgi:hypothetical protein
VTQPDIGSWAQAVYGTVTPLADQDAKYGYPLALYLGSFGQTMQQIDDWVRDDIETGIPGWAILLDVDRCPIEALPWLGQFVGVHFPSTLTDIQMRAAIKGVAGWSRGSPQSLINAAKQYLTGAQTVVLRERDAAACPSDPPYGLTVITYTSQTPDTSKVLAALMAQKPAGIILNYVTQTGQDYSQLLANHASYANVLATYATYQGILNDQPGS